MPNAQETSRRANGVLPMPSGQAATEAPATTKSSRSKAPIEGDKVVIRRLPPGLTLEEFWDYLGDHWKVGGGLVDWFDFKKGKISQDPAKLSRPGRAYLHVMKRDYLTELSETVQSKTWEDAKATFNNACLVGPPVLEFSIYKRFPSNKKRNDQRQGTIDQDPEFMAYLLSLTNPEPERETNEDKMAEEAEADVKITTTPLIEYLKEKKANKAKEAALAKSAKHARQESQSTKNKGAAASAEEPKRSKRDKDSKTSKAADKPRETVKILTKKTASSATASDATKSTDTTARETAAALDAPKSRRANIAAAARILQRDLGLSPGSAHRKARLNAAKSEAEAKASTTTKENAKETPREPAAPPAPTPAPAASISSPAPAATQAAERAVTPGPAKPSRSRRGGKNAGEVKPKASDAKETVAAKPAPTATPAKPVVLLKKRDKQEVRDGNALASPSAPAAASAEPPAPAPTKSTGPAKNAAPAKSTAPAKSNAPAKTANPAAAANKSSGGGKGSSGSKKGSGPAVTPGATRGFVKHANPSQGVTEALLKQALESFGTITFVEIDRRKGFAYVDFSEHESLVKAVTSSPVTVAQAAVQILERKEKKPAAQAATTASGPATVPAEKVEKAEKAEKTEKNEKTDKADQPHSAPRRNRRGRGGKGSGEGGKDAKDGKEGGRPTATAKAGGGGSVGTG